MLASFRSPPGAIRTGHLAVAWLSQAPERPASPDLVTRTEWWRAPGQPPAVLAWVRAHLPAGFTFSGSGSIGQEPHNVLETGMPHPGVPGGNLRMWFDEFSRPVVPGVLATRWLLVAVASAGTDEVAIRVDSEVVWLPAKSAAKRIPATAKVVTIAAVPAIGSVSAHDQPVTVTDPAKVAAIAAVIDELPIFPPGSYNCPADRGGGIRLIFRATATGRALAVASGDISGCGTVAVTINGKPMSTLAQATSMQRQVLMLAGIHWPGFPPA